MHIYLRYHLVLLALCCAVLVHGQDHPGQIQQLDIYYIPVQKSFRREIFLKAELADDSLVIKRAHYHLSLWDLPELRSIQGLELRYLNTEHLAAEQPENDIIYGLFRFTTASGDIKRVYMSGELRFYYEGKWYDNPQLVEVLFQYLQGNARPPKDGNEH